MRHLGMRLWFLLYLGIQAVHASEETKDRLLEWFRQNGGKLTKRQEVRLEDPSLPGSRYAIFAKEPIKSGELLAKIPWKLITMEGGFETEDKKANMNCALAHQFVNEMKLGSESKIAPYVEHLLTQSERYNLPSSYSQPGKELFVRLFSYESDARRLLDHAINYETVDWQIHCKGDLSDKTATRAAMLAVQHAYEDMMVPIWDLYTHANGNQLNTKMIVFDGDHIRIKASRAIAAGEQIHSTYNTKEGLHYPPAEILRDHGIVEGYPHYWQILEPVSKLPAHLDDGTQIVVSAGGPPTKLLVTLDEATGLTNVQIGNTHPSVFNYVHTFFRQLVQELYRFKHIHLKPTAEENGVPQHEWDAIMGLFDIYVGALKRSFMEVDPGVKTGATELQRLETEELQEVCQAAESWDHHYTDFDVDFDIIDYNRAVCPSSEWSEFFSYQPYELERSNYQEMKWQYRPRDDDTCLHLDGILQICSGYRPHYHEFFVHYPARYVPSVKRVIFLGSGDAMLLHEILKYPELEKVVGLELDQHVTRKSFKHFKTQPHYDDPRVEWWYGDATKTLPLLPQDYWGSFDLLLVDLSETVVSLHVTGQHDILDVISMLLKPEGVMLENELYIDTMSEHFDHTVHIFYGSPKVCIQVHTVSSNGVDFLNAPIYDHGIDMHLIDTVEEESDRYRFIHDYIKSTARGQGKCNDDDINATTTEYGQTAGVMMVLEAEKTTVALDESLAPLILETLQNQGLNPVHHNRDLKGTIHIVMKEGYVVARVWPELNYVGFDINFWGAYQKMNSVRTALEEVVGSERKSSFRIVVGGMHGSSTWDDDQNEIGILFSQKRDCTVKDRSQQVLVEEDVLHAAFDLSLDLLPKKDKLNAVVVCGAEEDKESCIGVTHSEPYEHLIPLFQCDGLHDFHDDSESLESMVDCEKSLMEQLENIYHEIGSIDVFVMDTNASHSMLQLIISIFSDARSRQRWLSHRYVVEVPFRKDGKNRRLFLEQFRKFNHEWIATLGEIHFRGQTGDFFGYGCIAYGNEEAVYAFNTMEKAMKKKFPQTEATLRLLEGGRHHPDRDLALEEKSFRIEDYDHKPNELQFEEQHPLGRQTIFQLEVVGGANMPSVADLKAALETTCSTLGSTLDDVNVTPIGDGVVVASTYSEGDVILSWDGREHVDVNVFHVDENKKRADDFLERFLSETGGKLVRTLRDDIPRGIGRVVNFQSDIDKDNMAGIQLQQEIEHPPNVELLIY